MANGGMYYMSKKQVKSHMLSSEHIVQSSWFRDMVAFSWLKEDL